MLSKRLLCLFFVWLFVYYFDFKLSLKFILNENIFRKISFRLCRNFPNFYILQLVFRTVILKNSDVKIYGRMQAAGFQKPVLIHCFASHWNGFYRIGTSVMTELMHIFTTTEVI